MNRFEEQVAIVTGGASGIGAGIAHRLAAEGAHVALFDVDEEALEQQATGLKQENLSVSTAVVDITDEAQVEASTEAVAREHGQLDVLVNSAGIVGPTSTKAADYALSDFQEVVRVNLTGSFLMTKHALGPMLEQGYGRILLIASIGGKEGNPGMAGYASSKSGVMGLVKGVGKEYAGMGITVNGLAPAVIRTPMNEDTSPEMLEYMTEKIPMNRLGTIEEVAALACWIVSEEASFNTGFVFDLSGGRATY